ncbi:heavy-metal-associated domain-containing protein [Methanococcoides methylutens]|uniref:Copper-translocating P-type ATPase n=1 Tax=Methanococcoides methylutens MM1 TaxID=1434104 RepID=A0A0E3SRY5_METMT|nr:cation transporter [Methanococcoides methylutens]AKB85821.1 Copper-translocating P-type ATPase [Methanococcoides methylutens MM1]
MKVTIDVHGMTCMHCHGRVISVSSSLEGTKTVQKSLEDNNTNVSFDLEKVTIDEVRQVVIGTGQEVVKI